MYANAQSLYAHRDEIEHQILRRIKPAVMALWETRVTNAIEDWELNVPGYNIIRCDAENRFTGGVALYVRNDVEYGVVRKRKIVSNCWCLAMEVKDKIFKGVLVIIYHSPSASHSEFISLLEDIVEEIVIKGQCIVFGDFNIDLMVGSYYAKKLQSVMLSFGMKQYVDRPTRNTNNSQTMIDLVFANTELYVQVKDSPKITDHEWLKIEISKSKRVDKYREFCSRDYSNFSMDKLVGIIESGMEQVENMNVNIMADELIDKIVKALDTVAPKKSFKILNRWEGKRWYSDVLRAAAIRRDKAYRKAVFTKLERDWMEYRIERNRVIKLIRIKKRDYYEEMIDCKKGEPASMWKTLKELIRGCPTQTRGVEIDY